MKQPFCLNIIITHFQWTSQLCGYLSRLDLLFLLQLCSPSPSLLIILTQQNMEKLSRAKLSSIQHCSTQSYYNNWFTKCRATHCRGQRAEETEREREKKRDKERKKKKKEREREGGRGKEKRREWGERERVFPCQTTRKKMGFSVLNQLPIS